MDLIANRQIRVFISSTFRDMGPERDYLIGKIFPRLRAYCSRRNVEFIELDLRWGITEEEARSGKVAEICFREIERTRPFFIGLLGDRYGWTPSLAELERNPVLREDFGWMYRDLECGLSITEMEMQFGVLRAKEPLDAFFFLRHPEAGVPAEFREEPGSEAARKLSRLKAALLEQETYPVGYFHSPEDLGEQVWKTFTALIDKLFPEQNLSELELQRNEHESFLRSLVSVYIPQENNYGRLDRFMEEKEQFLILTGESGSGKSALVANWVQSRRKTYNIIPHFLGVSQESTDENGILFRLHAEIRDRFRLETPLPEKTATFYDLKKGLGDILEETRAKGIRLVLALDGLDKIKSREAKMLSWLPPLPSNIKAICSVLPGDPVCEMLEKRGGKAYPIVLPDRAVRTGIIEKYLGRYGKSLLPEQIRMILEDDKMKNPLMLRTLLDELRVFGVHERVNERIRHYLDASDQQEFFDRILRRMEQEYDPQGAPFVARALSLIAVSRNGLSEKELLDLTGTAPVYWSQLYNAFSLHLVTLNGLVGFSGLIRESIIARYFGEQQTAADYRKQLIGYFGSHTDEEEERQVRNAREISWQYYRLEEWENLYKYLLSFQVFNNLYFYDRFMLADYWEALEKQGYSLTDYLNLPADGIAPAYLAVNYNLLSLFCRSRFHYETALRFAEREIEVYRRDREDKRRKLEKEGKTPGPYFLRFHLIELADLYIKCRYFDKAAAVYEEVGQEIAQLGEMVRDLPKDKQDGYRLEYAEYLNYMGVFYEESRQPERAREAFTRASELTDYLLKNGYGKHEFVLKKHALIQRNLAGALRRAGKKDEAYKFYIENLETVRELRNDDPARYEEDEAKSLHDLAVLQSGRKEMKAAEKNYLKAVEIWRSVVKRNTSRIPDLQWTLSNLGKFYTDWGRYKKAQCALSEALDIAEKLESEDFRAYAEVKRLTLWRTGNLYLSKKDYEAAQPYYDRALDIVRRSYSENPALYACELVRTLTDTADCYRKRGFFAKAEALYIEDLTLSEPLFMADPDTYYTYYETIMFGLADLYEQQNMKEKALEICCRQIGVVNAVYRVYGDHITKAGLKKAGSLYLRFQDFTGCVFHANHYEGNKKALKALLGLPDPQEKLREYIDFLYERMVKNAWQWSKGEEKVFRLRETVDLMGEAWRRERRFIRLSRFFLLELYQARTLNITADEEAGIDFLATLAEDIEKLELEENAGMMDLDPVSDFQEYVNMIVTLTELESQVGDPEVFIAAVLVPLMPVFFKVPAVSCRHGENDLSEEFLFALEITKEYTDTVLEFLSGGDDRESV